MIPEQYWLDISKGFLMMGMGLCCFLFFTGIAYIFHGVPPKRRVIHHHYMKEE